MRRALAAALVCLVIWVLPPDLSAHAQPPPEPDGTADSWPPPAQLELGDACSTALTGSNRTFNVGPGREHSELTTVPWLSLEAGDVVNIYYREAPYRTKIGLRAQGTASAPVVINGVTDGNCQRPTISGADAVTSDDAVTAQFFSPVHTEFLGTIFLYRGPGDPFGYRPQHITIQNLHITGSSTEDSYTGQDGTVRNYGRGAAGVFAIVVDDLTLENNEITGNGNGVFVNTKSADETSHRIVIRRNSIHSNGTPGSYLEHNLYVQARRALYEGNYIGQLVEGAEGSSLKDRSSGTVVRYNHIDAAARALDLVEIEGGVPPVKNDPLYASAWVYGNLIVSDHDRPALSSSLLVHWGGDNDPQHYRDGTLYFYNNTVIINATLEQRYWFAIFDMDNNDQRVVAHSNVFANLKDAFMYLGRSRGTIELRGVNWATEGWGEAGGYEPDVTVINPDTVVSGVDPGLTATFRPGTSLSPVVDAATPVDVVAPEPAIAANLRVDASLATMLGVAPRAVSGAQRDLGAFEFDDGSVNIGDGDCDGSITIRDTLAILQHSLSTEEPSTTCPITNGAAISLREADLDTNGVIDSADVRQHLQCIVDRQCP